MSALEKLATHLVAEVPVARLQEIFVHELKDGPASRGMICGGGCSPTDGAVNGFLCGFNCGAAPRPRMIDPEGVLGLTSEEVSNLRSDIPSLRHAVAYQIELHLKNLR